MNILFPFLGGLGFFLYGTEQMSKALQRTAGNRLKGFIRSITQNRFLGVLSGTLATAIVQSSSVTTVMIVGFVNAGLMALPQAISVILGAHIGTTITAQIIAFRIQDFALPAIAIGSLLHLFGRADRIKDIGDAIFGFGSLFFGLNLMGLAFDPLKDTAIFENFLHSFASHPALGLLAGFIVTLIVQSSSVTTGITIALALSNAITFQEAVPLILGENIGTTFTANIAAIGGSGAAKQAARAHFIINLLGAAIIFVLLKPFMELTIFFSPKTDVARQIANAHTYFNVITTILFLPFLGIVARMTNFLILETKRETDELAYLEKTSLEDPGTALDQVKIALITMNSRSRELMKLVADSFRTLKERHMDEMRRITQKIEQYQSRITEFLEKIAGKRLSREDSKKLPQFMRILHEVERIRDYEEKLIEVFSHLRSEGRDFQPQEKREIQNFFTDVLDLLLKTSGAIGMGKKEQMEITNTYESLRKKKDELRELAKKRLLKRRANIATANYYFDVVSSLEEVAKKCRNIAVAMVE